MIGGVIRIPKVKEIISSVFSEPLNTNINGDDGPALGAAFLAANFSVGIKVKKVHFEDGPNFVTEFEIKTD